MRVILPSLLLLALGSYWIAMASGTGSPLVTHWAYLAITAVPVAFVVASAVRCREQRLVWGALAVGLVLWTAGSVWQVGADSFGVSVASPGAVDVLWLSMYPCALVTFFALGRPWVQRAGGALALDAVTIMLVTASIVTALILPQLLANSGELTGFSQLVFCAYPVADCVLMAVALIGAAVAGRRAGAVWGLLAAGTVALVVGDIFWTTAAANGTWAPVMGSNALYPAWPVAAAIAAWRPLPAPRRAQATFTGVRANSAALVAVIAGLALLVLNEWLSLPAASVCLAALGLLAAVHRTGLALTGSVRASFAAHRDRELVDDVREALDAGELELHFQPLVDVRTGAVHGAEALLRWERMRPDEFLPAVERSELITPLTDWVLDRALAAAACWRADGHDLGVSVNLATANLGEFDLPARVIAALRRHGVPAAALTLEITETAAVEDSRVADEVLAALDAAGIAISIDDFGTGHSSLVRIARFPIREIKVDRSFVLDIHNAKLPIVATSVELAHALGLRVVAEGVEDEPTFALLRALGCDIAQGYHLSRPLAPADFAAWLQAASPAPVRAAEAARTG